MLVLFTSPSCFGPGLLKVCSTLLPSWPRLGTGQGLIRGNSELCYPVLWVAGVAGWWASEEITPSLDVEKWCLGRSRMAGDSVAEQHGPKKQCLAPRRARTEVSKKLREGNLVAESSSHRSSSRQLHPSTNVGHRRRGAQQLCSTAGSRYREMVSAEWVNVLRHHLLWSQHKIHGPSVESRSPSAVARPRGPVGTNGNICTECNFVRKFERDASLAAHDAHGLQRLWALRPHPELSQVAKAANVF